MLDQPEDVRRTSGGTAAFDNLQTAIDAIRNAERKLGVVR